MVGMKMALTAGGAVVDLLDRLEFGAVLLDCNGAVVHANETARRIFGTGIDVARGILTADDPRAAADLQRLVEGAVTLPFSLAATRPATIQRAGQRPVVVEAIPIAEGMVNDPLGVLRAILLVTDLGAVRKFPEDRLRAAFRLTHAEARLAAHLARGEDLDSAVHALGVTRQTARSQLKMIFAKTETHRQAELVALLSRLSGGLQAGATKP